ncbi:MAG: VacJ family lipoprotein [Rhodospirillales bacterium]|nr:VacJ family lipoprotein [Rhodospirillales bacterium]
MPEGRWRRPRCARIVAGIVTGVVFGAATPVPALAEADPFEPFNRAVFEVNRELDRFVLRPTTVAYRFAVPVRIRQGIGQFLDNLLEPVHALNAGLQGDAAGLEVALSRFLLNTIVGLGGFIDVAAQAGVYRDPRGFGQTLGRWGSAPGPYLVLPVLGPSTARELAGLGMDALSTPHYYLIRRSGIDFSFQAAETGLRAMTFRDRHFEQVDAGLAGSLDPYASARSVYWQLLRGRHAPPDDPFDDTELDFDAFEE